MIIIDSSALRLALHGHSELAFLDVREQGEFGQCHLFHAVNAPLSRLELDVVRLVPRRGTRIVVTGGETPALADRAVDALARLGYTDISACPDTPTGWEAAGFKLYSGINVPSKAFGEAVEHHFHTPSIDAGTLKAMQDGGDALVVLDSRTFAEYRNMNIPGGVSVPGGELAYRVRDFAPNETTTVVVNCAGRTRSIVGAQSVINAGVSNRVVALENGTMGWHLAGLELEHGRTDSFAAGDPDSIAAAQEMRARIAREYGIKTVDAETLSAWQDEAETRTLYLLDVRSPEEYAAGHLRGSRSAPGGQLVQATDFQIGVPRGRIVLIDDTGVRATMTAHWLVQMGFADIHVLAGGLDNQAAQVTGADLPVIPMDMEGITPEDLAAEYESVRVTVIDLGESRVYRKAHIPDAHWAIRTRIADRVAGLPQEGLVVLTSADGLLAQMALAEVRALTAARVRALVGGTDAWIAAGHPTDADPAIPPDEACVDVYLRAYDRNTAVEVRMQEYIDWEVALIEQIANDPDVRFSLGPLA